MSNALYLPDWTVLNVENGDGYVVKAKYDVAPLACAKCGVLGQLYRHGAKAIRYRDAPVHGKQTVIEVQRARYRCRACEGTFMQALPDIDDERRMTIRCRDYIAAQALLKPNTHVAEDVGIDEKVVRQIGKENAASLFEVHAAETRAPRVLGMDELFLGDQMRAIFVNVEDSWPIEILPTRWAGPVANYLMNLRGREEVEIVTMDMWKPYKVAVQHAMPQAVIIIDKWHVMRMANDVMEIARRRSQGLLTAKDRRALKARRASFLKRPFQLSAQEQLDLDGWLKNTPGLQGAYETKEAFMDIWRHRSREAAKLALDQWRASIPTDLGRLFRPVVTALKNWEPEVLNYFDHGRHTNAPTEARNRVIKMINRLGAGYSFDAIRARALFGKRPGRVKAEKAAEAARANLLQCWSCKAFFPAGSADAGHIIPKGKKSAKNLLALCSDCNRFYTERWFNHDSDSTTKSE